MGPHAHPLRVFILNVLGILENNLFSMALSIFWLH